MKRFLAIGECMIEMAPTGQTGEYKLGFAGDTFNTAWYLRRLAEQALEVGYFSAIGDDTPSDQMEAFMQDAGVTPHLLRRAGQSVGLYLISLNNGERSFSYWRSAAAARTLAQDLEALPGLEPGDIAYFSGITLAILPDADRKHFLSVLNTARDQGITIAFDPNLRPRLWASDQEMCAEIMDGAAVSNCVLPSFEDEASYFGDVDPKATANRYEKAGVTQIVVKNGGDPILLRDNGSDCEIIPQKVTNVVDTTAAGDSFNAGFFASLARGESPEMAVKSGCEIAAKVIGARGGLVPI